MKNIQSKFDPKTTEITIFKLTSGAVFPPTLGTKNDHMVIPLTIPMVVTNKLIKVYFFEITKTFCPFLFWPANVNDEKVGVKIIPGQRIRKFQVS